MPVRLNITIDEDLHERLKRYDSCNRYGTRVVVLPITSNVTSLYPGEAMVSVKGKPGRALGDQIRSIDKGRLKARAGAVTAEEMARIDEALAITLALQL